MRFLQPTTVLIAAASLTSAFVPGPPTSTQASTSMPLAPTPHPHPSGILSASVAHSEFDDRRTHDRTIFSRGFKLPDRPSIADNLVNISVRIGNSLKVAFKVLKEEMSSCFGTVNATSVVNIVFRATVRGLTPGYMLLDQPSIEWILDDITAAALAEDRLLDEFEDALQSSSVSDTANVDSLAVFSTPAAARIPTLSDVRYWLKYLIVNLDFSAAATLAVRATMSHLDLDEILDTCGMMEIFDNLLDVLGCVSRKPHRSVGEIMLSLDATFPSLCLSPLRVDIPLPFQLDLQSLSALPPAKKPFGYARPPAPSQDYETLPISSVNSFAQELVGYARPPTPNQTDSIPPVSLGASNVTLGSYQPPHTALSNHTVEEYSAKIKCRDFVCVVLANIARVGSAVMSKIETLVARLAIVGPDAERMEEQDKIKFHALQAGLARLPAKLRQALLLLLSDVMPADTVILKSDYKIPDPPG